MCWTWEVCSEKLLQIIGWTWKTIWWSQETIWWTGDWRWNKRLFKLSWILKMCSFQRAFQFWTLVTSLHMIEVGGRTEQHKVCTMWFVKCTTPPPFLCACSLYICKQKKITKTKTFWKKNRSQLFTCRFVLKRHLKDWDCLWLSHLYTIFDSEIGLII